MKQFNLTNETIKKAIEDVTQFLEKSKTEHKEILKTTFALEDTLRKFPFVKRVPRQHIKETNAHIQPTAELQICTKYTQTATGITER